MNNLSLKKITFVVAIAAFTSPFVTADEAKENEKSNTSSSLIAHFDTDKDGTLNKAEVGASDKKKLQLAFDKIDSNGDAEITEAELNIFLAQAKTQTQRP